MVAPEKPDDDATNAARRLRLRNRAMFAVLMGLFAIIYAVTMVKGGHH
jgi:hypothetical protein